MINPGREYTRLILMKKLVGVVIELDPFIIAEDDINTMKKDREGLSMQIDEVGGKKEALTMKLNEKNDFLKKATDKVKAAQKISDNLQIQLAVQEYENAKKFIEKLTPIKNTLEIMYNNLKEMYRNTEFVIKSAKAELDYEKELYETVTLGNNAFQKALKFFDGDPEKKLMLEQSKNALKENIGKKMSSMKRNMEISSDIMKGIDLENGIMEEKALRMINEINLDEFKLSSNDFPKNQMINIPVELHKNSNNNSLLDD